MFNAGVGSETRKLSPLGNPAAPYEELNPFPPAISGLQNAEQPGQRRQPAKTVLVIVIADSLASLKLCRPS